MSDRDPPGAARAADEQHVENEATRDRPDAFIARDRRRALHAGHTLPDRVRGAALFADISGFTPLTEALAKELGPQRGAEELVANIGRVFHAVIAALDAYDGNVISFAGDAITCWIDGDDGSRACAAAFGMLEAIARTGTITTPGGMVVQLAMKVAIATGSARRFVVGDPDVQLIDVLAGRLLDTLAAAEHNAERGEIVLDQSVVAAIGSRLVLGASREDADTERTVRVLVGLRDAVEPVAIEEPEPLPEPVVRQWLLPEVYERMRTGRGEFLAELRPAIPLFLRFTGIDYDRDEDAVARLDQFVRAVQRIMHGYGGSVLQLTLGDKGAYLYGVFGSPRAHEDDAARAVTAAHELRDLERSTAARDISIGVAHGRLRSGSYGHSMRRTFVCTGDAVNLAARLMSKAPRGSVYVADAVRRDAGDAFIWKELEPLRLKGKAEPVHAWSLTGSLEGASRRKTRFELDLVGRLAELDALDRAHAASLAGQGSVVGIAAEAGMGKSRLVAEFVRNVRRAGHTVVFGECQAYGTRTPYFVWREIWRRLFGLEDEPVDMQIATLERRLAAVNPGLVARAPLLADVVGLSIADTDLTRDLDAKLRKASLEDLLVDVLRARAGEAPFVAVLEDCHWIDELSRDLLQVLVRAASRLPILFVLAYRPAGEPGGDLGMAADPGFSEIELTLMDTTSIAALARAKAAQLAGSDVIASDEVVALVAERAEGNPFYAEELVAFLVARGVALGGGASDATVLVPDSLHSLVLSRIDAAAEGPRRTMKVASIVGRVFEAPVLPGAYEELGSLDAVLGDLDALRSLDLVSLDRAEEQAWMFKHAVTQEVAYESLPFALRAELHGRVGSYLEQRAEDDLDRWVPLLEHHYWRSDREEKKRLYLRLAADQAQASFANSAAIAYYDRFIPLLDGAEQVDAALSLAGILQLVGDLSRAEQVARQAWAWAVASGDDRATARCEFSLAETARRQARFDEALSLLASAGETLRALGDRPGTADVLRVTGTVHAQRGELDEAQIRYRQSLRIRELLDDPGGVAAVSNNLAIIAVRRGDPEAARALGGRAVELYRELGDRRYICSCLINLAWLDSIVGEHQSALAHCEEAIRLAREVGDRLNLALAHNNMGDALRDLGRLEDAGAAYAQAVEGYRDLGDHGPLMALFEDVGVLATLCGRVREAHMLVGASDALRAVLGSPRPEAAETELLARLAAAPGALGEAETRAAREAGASLSLEAAVAAALAACRAGDAPGA